MNEPRIKILQYMYGDCEYFPWSEWINRRYSERHGYEYVIRRNPPRPDRHLCWQKIPIILDELYDCEYLLFLDADAVFYSHELKIEQEVLPLMEQKTILFSSDCGGEYHRWNPPGANSGVIFARTDDLSREIFSYWNSASDLDEGTRWNWPPEQLAFERIVLPKYRDFIKIEPEYYRIQGYFGQYIRHYCRASDDSRTTDMKMVFKRLAAVNSI